MLISVMLNPSRTRIIAAAVISIAAVQCLVHNLALMFALIASAAIVCLVRRDLRQLIIFLSILGLCLLSFIPFLAPICGPLALIAGGLALGIDLVLCATGHGDWKSLAVDAALMALPGAGKLLRLGVKALRGGTEAAEVAEVAYGSTRLSKAAINLRRIEGMTTGGNVAVARVTTWGRETIIAVRNETRARHAEKVLIDEPAK